MVMQRFRYVLALVGLCSCGSEPPPSQRYPGPWIDVTTNLDLMRTLDANQVRGCGEMMGKVAKGTEGKHAEYLLYCTRDGTNWAAWLVWPAIGKVSGPSQTYLEIAPPR